MKHARADYDHIQDLTGKIPTDEPVFLIRGQDKHAAAVLAYYASLVAQDGGDRKLWQATLDQAHRMLAWQESRAVKAPDMPEQN